MTIPLAAPSPVRTLLHGNIAMLMALSAGIFAFAEGAPLAAITIPIAFCALLWTDLKQTFVVNHWVANGLGLAAFVAAGFEFFGESIEGRLLAFGHLLFYLTWILLLQKKETPQIWWLCALSVLQVATASVLISSLWLGVSLIVYVLFTLWTLSVFSLDRAIQRSAKVENSSQSERPRDQQSTEQTGPTQKSVSRNAVRREGHSGWITSRFVIGVVINGLLSMFVGVAFFVFTPRIWIGGPLFLGSEMAPAVRAVTGFTDEVSLGDMGEILENHDLVLEVSMKDFHTGQPIDVNEHAASLGDDAPLFRGAVLDSYDNGRWSVGKVRYEVPALRGGSGEGLHIIEQDILMSSISSDTLFSCGAAITCISRNEYDRFSVEHDRLRDTFRKIRLDANRSPFNETFKYRAYSLANNERTGWQIHPGVEARYAQLVATFPDDLDPIRALARQVAMSSQGSPLPPTDAARQLVSFLRDSGEYEYSLNLSIDDPTIDPVVDFLINRKRGHCEYFASALVLMLRSVGIPARYLSGFKGGTDNAKTGRFEVRQLHAHAWAEAYVDDHWIVLDPTPAARDLAVREIGSSSHFWADLTASIREMWTSGLTMSGEQQRQLFISPLKKSMDGVSDLFANMANDWTLGAPGTEGAGRSSTSVLWRALVGLAAVSVLIFGLVWLLRNTGVSFKQSRGNSRSGRKRQMPSIEFYERFRTILARNGHERDNSQTQREFATGLDRVLTPHISPNEVTRIPEVLTNAFYLVRFGHHELPSEQVSELNASLDNFERSLASENGDQ